MRIFVQFNPNKVVVAVVETNGLPGGPPLPANLMEVTGRSDGPWLGKVYLPGTDAFEVAPATKSDLEVDAIGKYTDWWRWKQIRLEAQARSEQSGVVNALTNKENAAWADLRQALIAWNQTN